MAVDLVKIPELRPLWIDYLHDEGIEITAEPADKHAPSACPSCAGTRAYRHGVRSSKYADIPIASKPVRLVIEWPRYRCRQCRAMTTPTFGFIDEKRRATTRLVSLIQRQCLDTTFSNLARQTGLAVNTIKNITLDLIEEIETSTQIETPVLLGLSTISMARKPRLIITNLATRTLYDILEELSPDFLNGYWKESSNKALERNNVQWVCLELQTLQKNSLADIFPNAQFAIGHESIIKMLLEALEATRKDYQPSLDKNGELPVKKSLKKLLSLKQSELSSADKEDFSILSNQYPKLMAAYECKEAFFRVYDTPKKEEAIQSFEKWQNLIQTAELSEFQHVADVVQENFEEFFAYWDTPKGLMTTLTDITLGAIQRLEQIESGYSFEVLRAKMLYRDYPQRIEQILAKSALNEPHHGPYISRDA